MEYISSIEQVRSEQKFQEGKLDMLRRLLARRFGDLPPAIQALLQKASGAQIEAWFDRGMEAQTLDEVFQGLAQ